MYLNESSVKGAPQEVQKLFYYGRKIFNALFEAYLTDDTQEIRRLRTILSTIRRKLGQMGHTTKPDTTEQWEDDVYEALEQDRRM